MNQNLQKIYSNRFNSNLELINKNKIWKILCTNFFQKYINNNAVVLDIGAGFCEFINNISAKEKIAIDLNENLKNFADKNVKIFITPADNLNFINDNSIDVIFISNFFEHMESKKEIENILIECRRILKDNNETGCGRLLILQPNIRFVYNEYWDFFDHNIPLSDRSLIEILEILKFKIVKVIPQFLPYSTKSRLPKGSLFIKLYLLFPFIWKIFGKQAFIVAEKY